MGRVAEVRCDSKIYPFDFRNERSAEVAFVIHAFETHRAFLLSEHCVFGFRKREWFESFLVSARGEVVSDYDQRVALIDKEDLGQSNGVTFSSVRIEK